MNLHIINVIIGREYITRVKKKSFILTTFLVPILFAAMCILPSVIMMAGKDKTQKVAVVDRSGIVMPVLADDELAQYSDYSSFEADSVKNNLESLGMDILLVVSPIDSSNAVSVASYSKKPLGVDLSASISGRVDEAVEQYRIASYNIDNLEQIMASVKSDVHILTYTLDDSGNEKISSSEIYMLVSMVLGMIIYMFIAIFCGMVMSSVIEEKASRVVEVLVSSVKATELMFGKIIGVALVALTQFFMWVIVTAVLVGGIGAVIGFDSIAQGAAATAAVDPSMAAGMTAEMTDAMPIESIMGTLSGLNYGLIIVCFVIFFVFGYLLYASLFAAIGSAVENEADSQQLQIPVTIPLLIGFFIAIYVFKAPESGVVFWGSMIPFTSPIVMLARIPLGVPAWQLILSIALLVGTVILIAWFSAKIYKVGILMFGKKSTFRDLWNWMKQK